MTSITQQTKHVYQVAFSYRGVECREKLALERTKSNDKYVERMRAEILGKIERGAFLYTEYFPDSKRAGVFGLTVRKTSPLIKDALADYKIRAERTLEYSTYSGYRKSIDHVLIPWCGNLRVHELLPAEIRRWAATQTTSLKRVRNNVLPLSHVLNDAVADGVIDVNPFDRVDLARMLPPAQRESDYEPDPYTEEEVITLLARIAPADRWPFQAWAYTGVRTGELVGLRWPRVNMTAATVAITETTTERRDKPRPKTEAGRRVFTMLPAALEAFEQMRARTQLGGDRVFVNDRSTRKDKAWCDKRLAHVWKAAHKDTGIKYRNPYQLRHTFASNLLTQGENPSVIAKLLGHKDATMVLKVYAKVIERGAALGLDRPPRTYGMRRLWDSSGRNLLASIAA